MYDAMGGELRSFADPDVPVELPEGFDEGEAGVDGLVAELVKRL